MQIQNLILFVSFVGSNNPNWLTSEDITKNNLCFKTIPTFLKRDLPDFRTDQDKPRLNKYEDY